MFVVEKLDKRRKESDQSDGRRWRVILLAVADIVTYCRSFRWEKVGVRVVPKEAGFVGQREGGDGRLSRDALKPFGLTTSG